MKILALDTATRTGLAMGRAGEKPTTILAVRLKKPDEHVSTVWGNIGFLLNDLIRVDKPDLIALEGAMHPEVQKSADAVVLQWGVVACVHMIAKLYSIQVREVNSQTVSKHFNGKARWSKEEGGRDAKKAATIDRCHLLGYLPRDCRDTDKADACAIFDYASWVFGRTRMKVHDELHLFGERVSA